MLRNHKQYVYECERQKIEQVDKYNKRAGIIWSSINLFVKQTNFTAISQIAKLQNKLSGFELDRPIV